MASTTFFLLLRESSTHGRRRRARSRLRHNVVISCFHILRTYLIYSHSSRPPEHGFTFVCGRYLSWFERQNHILLRKCNVNHRQEIRSDSICVMLHKQLQHSVSAIKQFEDGNCQCSPPKQHIFQTTISIFSFVLLLTPSSGLTK